MHVASTVPALAVLLLAGGRLGDIIGRKRMLLVGIGGFTAASVACAAAETTSIVTVGLIALAFAAGFLLPRAPRVEAHDPAIGPEPAFA